MKSVWKMLAASLLFAAASHAGWAGTVLYTLTTGPITFWSAGLGPNTLQFTAKFDAPPTAADLANGIPFYYTGSSFNVAAEPSYAPLESASTTGPLTMYTVWFWGGSSSGKDDLSVALENAKHTLTFTKHFYFAPLSLSHNGTYNSITTGANPGLAGVLTVSGFADASTVPEPATVLFSVAGLGAIVLARLRKPRPDRETPHLD